MVVTETRTVGASWWYASYASYADLYFYRSQMKLEKGNVFTHVCDSVQAGGLCPGGEAGVSVKGVSAFLSVESLNFKWTSHFIGQ